MVGEENMHQWVRYKVMVIKNKISLPLRLLLNRIYFVMIVGSILETAVVCFESPFPKG
jgi:DNA relaxase NicK